MLYHIDPFYQGIVSINNNNNGRNAIKNKILSLNRIFNIMSVGESPVTIRTEIEPLFCLGSNNPYLKQEDISEFINLCLSPSLEVSKKPEVIEAFRSILNTINERTLLRENLIGQEGQETIITKPVPQLMIDIPLDNNGINITSLQDGINKEFGVAEKLSADNLLRQTKNKNSSHVPSYVKHQYKIREFMKTGGYVIFDFKRWKQEGGVLRKNSLTVPIEKNITLQVNRAQQSFGIQGIVFQSGGMGGGHYVYAWCSDPLTNTWKTFNDTVVTEVPGFSGDMAGFTLPLGDSNFSINNAYVLVYQEGLVHDPAVGVARVSAPAYKYTFETSGLSVSNYNTFAKFSPTEYAPRVKDKAPSLFGNTGAASAASEKASKSVKTLAAKLAAAKGASTGSAPRASAPRASAPRASAPAPAPAPDPFAALDPFAAPAASNNLLSFFTAPAPAAPAPAAPAPVAPAAPAPAAPAAPTPNGWVKFDGGRKRKTRKTKRKGNKRTRHRK
jgi:hypothetical protein